MRKKIFVSAYACEPGLGSEIGVGWHWILEMSKNFDLWVLTRESNRATIEGWLKDNKLYNCPNFIYYDIPKKWRFWKRGLRGVHIYYLLWQKLTNKLVKKTMEDNNIEAYHLLTYGNALWPVSKYGRKKQFIWGPTSVGNSVPYEFIKHYKGKDWLKEVIQALMVKSLYFNTFFRSKCKDANLILCKTEKTRLCIPEKYRDKAIVFTDVAVELTDYNNISNMPKEDNVTKFLAVGRLDAWRGFDILLEAISVARVTVPDIHLDLLGEGSDRNRLLEIIADKGLSSCVSLKGHVSLEDYHQYMANCDVVVNPALKEGAVTTAFDSMNFIKPLICIDTGGYSRYFNNDYSIVMPLTNRQTLVQNLAKSLIDLTNVENRSKLSKELESIRGNFTWEKKGTKIYEVISDNL